MNSLSTIGELFSRTWIQYKQRALPILAVVLIGTALVSTLILVMVLGSTLGGAVLLHLMQNLTGIIIMTSILCFFLLVLLVAIVWCQTTMLAIVIDEELGIIEAFQRGWEYLWPMTWVLTFLTGILTTGFFLGILPGFLFLVWFSFSMFILLAEDRRGLDTLLASREYVRGYGWDTFGKMAVLWLLGFFASLIPLLGQMLSILLTPFFMLYVMNMYRELQSLKGTVEVQSSVAGRAFWWMMTIIGLLLPVVVLAALAYFLLTGDQQWMPVDWTHSSGITL